MNSDLYTVVICTSKPVEHKAGGRVTTINQDVIETYYDATYPQVLAYRKKFAGEVTIEKQSRRLDRAPKIETGESPIAAERFPSVPRLHLDPQQRRAAIAAACVRPVGYTSEPHVISEPSPTPTDSYADLVNAMNDGV
jgi:hypothetical protein